MATRLEELLKKPVTFLTDCVGKDVEKACSRLSTSNLTTRTVVAHGLEPCFDLLVSRAFRLCFEAWASRSVAVGGFGDVVALCEPFLRP